MKIEVFPSLSGDCLLLTSDDGKRILADAGLPRAYEESVAAPLSKLREAGEVIDVAYVSHIDRDHIGGILRMLDHEVKWRAFDKRANPRLRTPTVPRPPQIKEIWHNAFLETVQADAQVELGSALAETAGVIAGLNAGAFGDSRSAQQIAAISMLALSVGDAIEVNWRIGEDQLDIPLNPPAGGKFMTADLGAPIRLGGMTIHVLGPTNVELQELRKEWDEWLEKSEAQLARLKRKHERDAAALSAATSPAALAARSNELATELVESDVTPPNLASLVLLVEEAGKTILLTGDAGDESLLRYIDAAGLAGEEGRLFVDVLKVPHHGAENSYSEEFVDRVRAEHYVFCGDGEHHNPEPEVVRGYLEAIAARPLAGGRKARLWFNCSEARASPEHQPLWRTIEAMIDSADKSIVARRSLATGEDRLALTL